MSNYNLSFMENTTDFLMIVKGVNDNSGGWMGGLFILMFFTIFFMAGKAANFDTKNIFLADSFICSIIAGILLGAEVIEPYVASIPMILLVAAIIVKAISDY